jgi:ankyrin repeat protein
VDHAQGLTALCAAAHRGQVDAVRVLLEAGAAPTALPTMVSRPWHLLELIPTAVLAPEI